MSRSRETETQEEIDRSTQLSVPRVVSVAQHPQRFTELDWEEKGEGGDRGDLGEKKESPKEERVIKPVITLVSKSG